MTSWHSAIGGGGWVVRTLTLVAFWSLVVFAVVAIFGGDREVEQDQSPREPGPERILDGRFARGGIDLAEYPARQDALRGAR